MRMTMNRPILAILASAVMACSAPTTPFAGLAIQTSISADSTGPGEPTMVTVSVTNWGKHAQQLTERCDRPFEVTTLDGTKVGPGNGTCDMIYRLPFRIAPGQTMTRSVAWDGDGYPSAWDGHGDSSRILPAGEYLIQGAYSIPSGGEIRSYPVRVHVTP